ncbi:hypothetical protein PV10_08377 [Exophiala mesophila]|uniref:Major facilitator superfamily (MFS) profile domain-containing protein n=1 Tax=Exophiala mesophila TaxID=212818 RepID=A0A0D1ZPJ9_EXOME|nr:uncharacterized protein PV10_08377 [Exophiala mesophila]KIV88723.1 hypothetical protein PV10_08377 [Exophiala mesophila]
MQVPVKEEQVDLESRQQQSQSKRIRSSVVDFLTQKEDESSHVLHPPDIGIRPWLQVVAGFLLMFNTWGMIFSFGTFQTYYTSEGGLQDTSSTSAVAWIGSIQAFLLLFGAAFMGRYFDMGYYRQLLVSGTCLIVFGVMMTSLATKYYQVLLSQGICLGFGTSCLLVPSVGLPSTWFERKRGLAVGIVSSGASVAGIILPIVVRHLIRVVGFGWATRIMGFICLATLSVSMALAKPRLPPRGRGTFIEYSALTQPEFAIYLAGLSVSMLGLYTFFTFVEEWAVSIGLEISGLPLVYLLPILNAASIMGRLIPSFISDYLGPLNTQAPALLICGISALSWLAVDSPGPLIALIVIYGFASGAVICLPPVAIASMTEDLRSFGGRMGCMFLAISGTSLAGPPINGAIIQHAKTTYDGARIFSGTVMIVAAALLWTSRLVKTKGKWIVKA